MALLTPDRFQESLALRFRNVPYSPGTMGALVAGRTYSLWGAGSILGGAGAAPPTTPGATCDNTTAGSVPLPSGVGSDTLYAMPLQLAAGAAGSFFTIDRLLAVSGISSNVNTVQTLNTGALPARASSGDLVVAGLEVGTIGGATPVGNTTLVYTNSASVGARTGVTNVTTPLNSARSFIPLFCGAGDVGIQSVQSIQFTTPSGTAGDIWLVLYRLIAREGLVSAAGGQTGQTIYDQGMPVIDTTACIQVLFAATATTLPPIFGGVPFVWG